METAIIGIILGSIIALFAFLFKKWTGGIEGRITDMEKEKMDVGICVAQHRAISERFNFVIDKIEVVHDDLAEVKIDVKGLVNSVARIGKRGE